MFTPALNGNKKQGSSSSLSVSPNRRTFSPAVDHSPKKGTSVSHRLEDKTSFLYSPAKDEFKLSVIPTKKSSNGKSNNLVDIEFIDDRQGATSPDNNKEEQDDDVISPDEEKVIEEITKEISSKRKTKLVVKLITSSFVVNRIFEREDGVNLIELISKLSGDIIFIIDREGSFPSFINIHREKIRLLDADDDDEENETSGNRGSTVKSLEEIQIKRLSKFILRPVSSSGKSKGVSLVIFSGKIGFIQDNKFGETSLFMSRSPRYGIFLVLDVEELSKNIPRQAEEFFLLFLEKIAIPSLQGTAKERYLIGDDKLLSCKRVMQDRLDKILYLQSIITHRYEKFDVKSSREIDEIVRLIVDIKDSFFKEAFHCEMIYNSPISQINQVINLISGK